MGLPLTGYRVLEMAHLIAGPACGMYLADMGADVIKVENPGSGDASRTAYARHLNGESAVFVTLTRTKRSVGLDLAHPDGRRVSHRLVEGADVVIEAYRGGVAERLGIDYDSLAAQNPRLVYCSLSAFGPSGPWREKPGLDMLVQAMGGLMAVTGEPDGTPILTGAPVVDTIGALLARQGIVTALLHRQRPRRAQRDPHADLHPRHREGMDGASGGSRSPVRAREPLRRPHERSPGGGDGHARPRYASARRKIHESRHARAVRAHARHDPNTGAAARRAHRRRPERSRPRRRDRAASGRPGGGVTKAIEFPPGAFRRMNEEDDLLFYALPRRVVHIDDGANAALRCLYAALVPA